MFKTFKDFVTWEKATDDTLDVKKIYIDIAGDIVSGVLLSQIVYWYLPNKQGKTKLRVKKNGHFWIAKTRQEWFEEIRLTEQNYKTSIQKLKGKKIVFTDRFKFDNVVTTHLRLNIPMFLELLNAELNKLAEKNQHEEQAEFYDYLSEQSQKGGENHENSVSEGFGEAPNPWESKGTVKSTDSERLNQPIQNGGINRTYNRDYERDFKKIEEEDKRTSSQAIKQSLDISQESAELIISEVLASFKDDLQPRTASALKTKVLRKLAEGTVHTDFHSYFSEMVIRKIEELEERRKKEAQAKIEQPKGERTSNRKTKRKEQLPEWFADRNNADAEKEQAAAQAIEESTVDLEEERRKLEEELSIYR